MDNISIQQSQSFPEHPEGKKIGDFVLIKSIGKGQYGNVYIAQDIRKKDNNTCAVKCIPKSKLKENDGLVGKLLQTEVQVLLTCDNKNVVKMIKYLESENNCYLVMEYCNEGDFEQFWRKKYRKIPEEEAVDYLKQILNGMRGLHEMNVIHRDLKLPNILLHDGQLKIADLGFAKRLNTKYEQVKAEALGTLGTMAPEIIEFKSYGILADMFSLGVIYYQLLFGVQPFSIDTHAEFLSDIKSRPPNFNVNGVVISLESKNLLTKMLKYDPSERIKWNEIYDHPLFAKHDGLQGGQYITKSYLVAQQVDMNKNKNFYNNTAGLETITGQNMIQSIRQQKKLEQTESNIIKEEQVLDDAISAMRSQQQQNKEINREISWILQLYLARRNLLTFLARLVIAIQNFKHSDNTNVYLPVFILLKKLYLESTTLKQQIRRKENIFNCKFFVQLYQNKEFLTLAKLLEDECKVIKSHLDLIMDELKIMLRNTPEPNANILIELCEFPSDIFEYNYKQTLMHYYMSLSEEKIHTDYFKHKQLNLLIQVLDSVRFDETFKLTEQTFIPDEYFNLFDFLTFKEKSDLIEEKLNLAFQ